MRDAHFIMRALFPGADNEPRVKYFSGYCKLIS